MEEALVSGLKALLEQPLVLVPIGAIIGILARFGLLLTILLFPLAFLSMIIAFPFGFGIGGILFFLGIAVIGIGFGSLFRLMVQHEI